MIVWEDYRDYGPPTRPQIYMYDLSTGQETRLTQGDFTRRSPRIYGNKIVWSDLRDSDREDIYMYDLSAGQETQVTKDYPRQLKPAIYSNKIAWSRAC